MLAPDITIVHMIAFSLVLISWFAYSWILLLLGRGTLSSQLAIVRYRWLLAMTLREAKPFDAVLLGHIIHSVAFFGSATLIVLAGVLSLFAQLDTLHKAITGLLFFSKTSLELFAIQFGFLTLILVVSFFSFTYSLRKLIYCIALIGAFPDSSEQNPPNKLLVNHASTVLSEAIKTFNFGIRGYYYAVACLFAFVSPRALIVATIAVTIMLIYRQIATPTSRAIVDYVETAKPHETAQDGALRRKN